MMKKQLKRLLCCLTLCAVLAGGLTVPAAAAGSSISWMEFSALPVAM